MLDEQQQEPSHSKNALYSLSLAERVIFNFKLNFSRFRVFIQLMVWLLSSTCICVLKSPRLTV